METEQDGPRRQLDEFNEAVRASDAGAWKPAPVWLFPLLALAGPAIVAWRTAGINADSYSAARENTLRFGSIALWALALGALGWATYREWANAEVRAKPPIRGGRTSAWMFLANFAVVVGLLMAGQLASHANPVILAVAAYLWLAIAPSLLWARHVKAMTGS